MKKELQDSNIELREWMRHFLKAKDVLKKEIKDIVVEDEDLRIIYHDKEKKVFIKPELTDEILLDNHLIIATLNTRKNFEWMCSKWNKLASYTDLYIYFINPKLTSENKWFISPYFHSKICDKETFMQGLESMFSAVQSL